MLQIAVIDDGIDAGMLLHPERLVKDMVVDTYQNVVRERMPEDSFLTMHGTICARIMELYGASAELVSVCIFDQEDLKTNCSRLAAALLWCMEMQIPLILMSVGTRLFEDYDQVRDIIAGMINSGQVIVAAGSNVGDYTMPAGMGGVLGVMAGSHLKGQAFSYRTFCKGIQIEASAIHRLINKNGGCEMTMPANSFAAPVLTAAVCRIMEDMRREKKGFLKVFQKLFPGKRYAAFRPDFIGDAVVLNLSEIKLLEEHFFFPCTEIKIEDIRQDAVESRGKKSFIFLPGLEEESNLKVLSYLEERQEQFLGILYCGKAGYEFIEKIKDCILWCEQDCGIYRQPVQEEAAGGECPIVFVRAGDWSGGELAWKLKRKFGEQGYQCIAVSMHSYSYLYGFEYIPAEIEAEKMRLYLETMYRPDIIIIWGYETGDMLSVKEKDVYNITIGGSYGAYGMSVYDSAEEFEKLYQDIVRYFS